jgi:hypothetical protein
MGKEWCHQVTSTFYSVLLYTSGTVHRVSILHKTLCVLAHEHMCTGLQVTAISAVQYAVCCQSRKWGRPNQNANMTTVNPTLRRQARLVELTLASSFSYLVGHVNRKAMYVIRHTEKHSPNNCCCVRTIIIAYSEFVTVAFVIQHVNPIRHIFIYGVLAPPPFSTLCHKQRDYRKNIIEQKMCCDFLYKFRLKLFSS